MHLSRQMFLPVYIYMYIFHYISLPSHPFFPSFKVELVTTDDDKDSAHAPGNAAKGLDPTRVRPDLQEVLQRQNMALDTARHKHDPAFGRRVERRHARGMRSARENVDDLCDAGTFVEYGRLRVAGQRKRRSMEDLVRTTPADGIITGIGCVNLDVFAQDREATRTGILAYDYTVLAGTQGFPKKKKKQFAASTLPIAVSLPHNHYEYAQSPLSFSSPSSTPTSVPDQNKQPAASTSASLPHNH